MRNASIYYQDHLAGTLTETDDGEYVFQYDEAYIKGYPKEFITFTMPVRPAPYKDKRLFPFFEGLIPEGPLPVILFHYKLPSII
jgi:serine/threonine-protein kinase HipA